MGLDMYLYARRYVSGWRHDTAEERNEFDRMVELFGMEKFVTDSSPSAYVEFTVAYWRKANAIHQWFVEYVQGGVDECQKADVSREQLEELVRLCDHVLGVRQKVGVNVKSADRAAAEKLPTQSGFFFGPTEYNEWYWEQVENTRAQIENVLKLPTGLFQWQFQYQSSW